MDRIDIFPINYPLEISQSNRRISMNPELEDFVEKSWLGRESWDNAWIPAVDSLSVTSQKTELKLGVISYKQVYGMLKAIDEKRSFAPFGIVPSLSIGILPVTSDGFLMLSRRSSEISNAPGVWNFAGGYMSSRFLARDEGKLASDPCYKSDPRVFDPLIQGKLRIYKQEFTGLEEGDFHLERGPSAIALGYKHSRGLEMGWIARFKKSASELTKCIREFESWTGVKEHSQFDWVHIDQINALLINQAHFLRTDPLTYFNRRNPKRAILLDVNIGALIGGAYKQLTGDDVPMATLEYLRNAGWQINSRESGFSVSF